MIPTSFINQIALFIEFVYLLNFISLNYETIDK